MFPGAESSVAPRALPANIEAEAAFLPPIEQPAGDAGGELAAGQQVFIASGCGGCHELAAADATGTVGPSLDQLDPTEEQVAEIVENGRGAMPAFEDQLAPEQIDAVAAYVAASAWRCTNIDRQPSQQK